MGAVVLSSALNIAAFDFEIDEDDMAALDQANERYSALATLPYA